MNPADLGLAGWSERPLPWRELVPGVVPSCGDAAASVAAVTWLVCGATGAAPLVVDLAGDEGIAVVKVLCPGCDWRGHDRHPRVHQRDASAGGSRRTLAVNLPLDIDTISLVPCCLCLLVAFKRRQDHCLLP